MLLSKALEGFKLSRRAEGYSNRTLEIYQWAFKRIIDYLGDLDAEKVTAHDLTRFMAWFATEYKPKRPRGDVTPLAPQSVTHAWIAVRSFYNWYCAEFGFQARPDGKLKHPRIHPPEIAPFTQNDILKLIAASERTRPANTQGRQSFTMRLPNAARDVVVIRLLLDTGLRAGELVRLRVKDVNIETGQVFVSPYGSGRKTKSRHVYIGAKTQRSLWHYLSTRDCKDDDPLLTIDTGEVYRRGSLRAFLDRLGKRAGVKHVHAHRFRHTFAIEYLRNGGDVFTLQRLLGHASLEMVKRYVAIAEADTANAHRKASPVDRWNV